MTNKQHHTLRKRLASLNSFMVYRAITGIDVPQGNGYAVTECPMSDHDSLPGMPESMAQMTYEAHVGDGTEHSLIIDNSRHTIKCYRCGAGGGNVQFAMDYWHFDEESAERSLVNRWNDMLDDDLKAAQAKDPECMDQWSRSKINWESYENLDDVHDDEEPDAYYKKSEQRRLLSDIMHLYQRNLWSRGGVEAFNYCLSRRWDKEMIKEWELGYCDWHTVESMTKSRGWDRDELKRLGIIVDGEKESYDTLHGRIIIPVRDRYGYICGFTSRLLKKEEEAQIKRGGKPVKYRSANNDAWVWPKSGVLFGLDKVANAIRSDKDKRVYMAEGNPDVMRLQEIGVPAVATMGTGVNDDTWKVLKMSDVESICFIPDIDVPKDGELWGVGIRTVMNNGKVAMLRGFNVTVREIQPPTSTKEMGDDGKMHVVALPPRKWDADDWFAAHPDSWGEIPEQSFILWYADKMKQTLPESPTPEQLSDWANDIAPLLLAIRDADIRQDYVGELAKLNKGLSKTRWKGIIDRLEGERKQRESAKANSHLHDLAKYGLSVIDGCYYLGQSEEPFSNFILVPKYFVKKYGDSHWIALARNVHGDSEVIDLDNDVLSSPQKFDSLLSSIKMLCEFGKSGKELKRLRAYITEFSTDVSRIDRLGWVDRLGVFAFGNGVLIPGGEFYSANEYGVVDYSNNGRHAYLPSAATVSGMDDDSSTDYGFERRMTYKPRPDGPSAKEIFQKMTDTYGRNGTVAAMFLVCCIFRDVIVPYSQGFPILCGYGPRSSGKSSIGKTLTSFFAPTRYNTMSVNLADRNTSVPAIDVHLTRLVNGIVQLDEYKNSISPAVIGIIKGLWDGEGRSVVNIQAKRKSNAKSAIRCGVVITGQEIPNVEAAMFSRFLPCEFYDDKDAQAKSADSFKQLKAWEAEGLSHATAEILRYRKRVEDTYGDAWIASNAIIDKMLKGKGVGNVLPRIRNNWCVLLAIVFCLDGTGLFHIILADAIEIVTDAIISQNKMNDSGDERAEFWNTFMLCVNNLKIRRGAHFKLKQSSELNELSRSTSERMKGETRELIAQTVNEARRRTGEVLLIRYKDVFPIIKAFARQSGTETKLMDSDSMLKYINHSNEGYIGMTSLERFCDVDSMGKAVQKQVNGRWRVATNCKSNVLVFDYKYLREHYDMDLESAIDINDETAGESSSDAPGMDASPMTGADGRALPDSDPIFG